MSSEESQRAALLALLGRKLVGEQLVKTMLFQQAIADRLGLNTTDLMCLSFLSNAEPLTAGQLAEATGLTTGSVTVMIDRLEKAGYVQREKDATDRRRVLVRPLTERIDQDITPLYAALGEAWERTIQHYTTEELAIILDMLTRTAVLLQEQTAALQREGTERAAPAGKPRLAVATAAQPVHHVRLIFVNGVYKTTVRGAALPDLYSGRFDAPEPRVTFANRVATVSVHGVVLPDHQLSDQGDVAARPRFAFWKRWQGSGTMTLNTAPTWQIEIRSGASDSTFDLSDLTLTGFAVLDGAYRLELNLGRPRGAVPIHISSGVADVTIRRPANTATQLVINGGAVHQRLDDRFALLVNDGEVWQTPNYATAADRYDITVVGGASKLSIIS
jgi:DNA-binding MarR family transcriptional regulator